MNKWTIMKKLSVLIILGLIAAVSFFAVSYSIGGYIIHERSMEGVNEKTLESLKQYVQENSVNSHDSKALMKWCNDIGEVDMDVFVEERLVFSSVFDMRRAAHNGEETRREKEKAVRITFADAEADVLFYKFRSLYRRMLLSMMILSLCVFFGIVVLGIRREVAYIHTINEEIQALEGGDLTREITIKGSSEITTLAESVDEFRKSMKNQLTTIEQLEKSNRLMAAEIAHDLRTPLTSLLMYLDFAQGEIQGKEPLAEEYLSKAREKSIRLKDLLDQNFNYVTMTDYFLKEKQEVKANEVLGGYIGDILTYLEGEDFHVRSDVRYGQSSILVQRDALGRVFSNLASNIMKYAKRDEEVVISCMEKGGYMELRVVNSVRVFEDGKPESTGFGSRIIRRLMEEMDGEYRAEELNGIYITTLRFLKA